MMDFEQARTKMVDSQIRPNDVTNLNVVNAFQSVPRENFVSAAQRPFAYIDDDLPLPSEGGDRYLMDSMSMAKLIQLAEIDKDSIVLDIGCGTGYTTAVLSLLCDSVVALESDVSLIDQATLTLTELGYDNTVVVNGPLKGGFAKEGPYDVIFIGGAISSLPQSLCEQLKDGGRLVTVEGIGNAGVAKLYTKENSIVSSRTVFNCSVKLLPGFESEPVFAF